MHMPITLYTYMHTYSYLFAFVVFSTDVSKSNVQGNIRYKDSRLHRGSHLMHYYCVCIVCMYCMYSCVSYHIGIIA